MSLRAPAGDTGGPTRDYSVTTHSTIRIFGLHVLSPRFVLVTETHRPMRRLYL